MNRTELIREEDNNVKVFHDMDGAPGQEYLVARQDGGDRPDILAAISFQNGAPAENGVNGVTLESMLAILIHRTQILDGKFPSEHNKLAIAHMKQALQEFDSRTAERKARGVVGRMKA